MMSWLCLGRVYPVVEWPYPNPKFDKRFEPQDGDERTRYGRPEMAGYDSHYVLVHKDQDIGYPCLPDQEIQGDEICVFRKEQV